MSRLASCVLLVGLALAGPASARVVVEIDVGDRPQVEFLVVTRAHYGIVHGTQVKTLDERLLVSGREHTFGVGFVIPLIFSRVVGTAYHPAYVHATQSSETYPFLLRPARLPPFEPVAWRDVLEGRAAPPEHGLDHLHPQNVFAHLRLLVDDYLPRLDAAGGEPDPRAHQPLFRELVARARATEIEYPDFVEEHRRTDVQYAATLERREKQWIADAEAALAEVEILLGLPSAERLRVHRLRTALGGRFSIVDELMTDDDRSHLEAALEDWWKLGRDGRSIDEPRSWASAESGVRYRVKFQYEIRKAGAAKGAPPTCMRVWIAGDLGAVAPPGLPGVRNEVSERLCRHAPGQWRRL